MSEGEKRRKFDHFAGRMNGVSLIGVMIRPFFALLNRSHVENAVLTVHGKRGGLIWRHR
jgi:hypothetical protein